MMRLNTLKPAAGSKFEHKRLGRGIGSGLGKTSGRGHKGQRARAGGFHKLGFEGGQMPMQRRLPKFGFTNLSAAFKEEIRLDQLIKVAVAVIDLQALKDADLINHTIQQVKIIATGKIDKPVKIKGLNVTKGARAAIEAVGGSIEA